MHTPVRQLASGLFKAYGYAWRGGPAVAYGTGRTRDEALSDLQEALSKAETLAKLAAAREAPEIKPRASLRYVAGLVTAFLSSAEFGQRKPRTRKDYAHHLDIFRAEFGDWLVSLFEDPRIAQDLSGWRDSFNSPRQGDMQLQVISVLFTWARSRGLTSADPTSAVSKIYKADRSESIWTDEQLAAVLAASPAPLSWAIQLAAETGLRQGDLLRLPWSAVSDMAIQAETSKRGKRVIIPITRGIRAVLDDIPQRSPIILTSSKGLPWTQDGLRSSFDRAKKRVGVTGLTWHDFRGTAITRLYKSGLTLRDLSRIFGLAEARIEAILTRYVSADAVAMDMLRRISTEQDV